MNRIFKKCSNFGLIVRLDNITPDKALEISRNLISGNVPLVTIDVSKKDNLKVLNKVAFSLDLFIAAEGVNSLESAYNAAGNGAQFFILDKPDAELITTLRQAGFFFLVKVKNEEELLEAQNNQVEAVVIKKTSLIDKCSLPYVLDDISDPSDKSCSKSIFNIISLPKVDIDYELWINGVVSSYLGHTFTELEISSEASEDEKTFAKLFTSLNKMKLIEGKENRITLECNSLTQTINNLKWREYYIDPNKSEINNSKVISGPLDTKLNGFTIILKEKNNGNY